MTRKIKDKKVKGRKKCIVKKKIKFKKYENCLEAVQGENKINHLEQNKIDIDRIKKIIINYKKECVNIKHNVFTEEINEIALSSNDDKRMQSIDSIGAYTYGPDKGLVSEKEEIKCSNIVKRYKI